MLDTTREDIPPVHAVLIYLIKPQLLLVDAMAGSKDEDLQDAAFTLQYQIYFNGEALERMLECMRTYKDQSFG